MINKYPISFEEAASVNIAPDAVLYDSIAPIVVIKEDGRHSAEGTAFCLAILANGEAVFATAHHVIRQLIDDPEMVAFLLLPKNLTAEPRMLASLPIRSISYAESNNDVALMMVSVADGGLAVTGLKWLPLAFGEPQVGKYCVGVGYPQTQGDISYVMQASRGVIEEIHPNRRDSSLSTFPSFRTNALYRGAMSGGPIVDENGSVIGIIAHSTEADDPAFVTGYGASIGAMGELRIRLHNQTGELQEFTAPELAERGVLRQTDRTLLRLDRGGNGVTLTWNPPEMEGGS
jgi:hypothetical protein